MQVWNLITFRGFPGEPVGSGNEGRAYGRRRTLEGNKCALQRRSSPARKVRYRWKENFIEYLMFENLSLKCPLYDAANYFQSHPTVHFTP
jgi:hypothetical protein